MRWTAEQNKAFAQMSMRAFAQLSLFLRWLAKERPDDFALMRRSLPENHDLRAQLGIRIGTARATPSKGGFDDDALHQLVNRTDGVGDAILWETCVEVEVNEATDDPTVLRRKLDILLKQFLGYRPALYSCDLDPPPQAPNSAADSRAPEETAPAPCPNPHPGI
jgi:hypothetical protein